MRQHHKGKILVIGLQKGIKKDKEYKVFFKDIIREVSKPREKYKQPDTERSTVSHQIHPKY